MDKQIEKAVDSSSIRDFANLYCQLKSNNEIFKDIGEIILFVIVIILNLLYWWINKRSEKKRRSRIVTLNAWNQTLRLAIWHRKSVRAIQPAQSKLSWIHRYIATQIKFIHIAFRTNCNTRTRKTHKHLRANKQSTPPTHNTIQHKAHPSSSSSSVSTQHEVNSTYTIFMKQLIAQRSAYIINIYYPSEQQRQPLYAHNYQHKTYWTSIAAQQFQLLLTAASTQPY